MRRLVIAELNFCVPEDTRVWVMAREAAAEGYDVTVVCPAMRGHRPGTVGRDGVDIRYFASVEARSPLGMVFEALHNTVRAWYIVLRLGLSAGDLLQVVNPPDTFAPLLRLLRRRSVATIFDQHDVVPLLARTKPSQRRLVPVHERLERATVAASTRIITAGQVQASRLLRERGRVATVVRTVAPSGGIRHVPPPQARVLGYVGVMGSQDGVDGLLYAVRELVERGRGDIRLRLAGDGPESERLRRLTLDLGLSTSVEFCGWCDATDLDQFLGSVHGLVVPDPVNPFNHSCPMLKVSHALSVGIPLVMTPLEENKLITGGLGWIASGSAPAALADAIERWMDSPFSERTDMGAKLRARYEQFLTWPRHRDQYLSVLREAVASLS